MPIQKTSQREIIKKSISVFRQKGYYRTNMSDLAAHCGLTKGAFYHHFANKEDVMKNCLEMTSSWFKTNVFSIAYNKDILDESKLKSMLEMYLKIFEQEDGGCFFANTILETTQVEDTFKEVLLDFFYSWERALTVVFKTKYASAIAKEKSLQLIAEIEGSIILMLLRDDKRYLKNMMNKWSDTY